MRFVVPFLLLLNGVLFSLSSLANTPIASGPTNRGLIALPAQSGGVYLSWRLLPEDTQNAAFDVYRVVAGVATRVNEEPIVQTTDYVDLNGNLAAGDDWYVKRHAISEEARLALKPARATDHFFQFSAHSGTHGRQFATGDLLGRGQLDFIVRQTGWTADPYHTNWRPSPSTYTLRAFDQNGDLLWVYDMGAAIEMGIWYAPFVVYDLDQDGSAEVIVKAGDVSAGAATLRDDSGRVMYGNEYVRVLSGRDGNTVLAQAAWPDRSGFMGGDPEGTPLDKRKYEDYNRWSRNFIAIAYLDGARPHVVVSRGTYGKMKTSAYLYQNGALQPVWHWENEVPARGGVADHWGQGAHALQAQDVDGDGRDEVILGALVLDDDGEPLYALGHGHKEHLDHVYIGDLDPSRPGKELYYGAEWAHNSRGIGMLDAATGEELWSIDWLTSHIHKEGVCADIDVRSEGMECYSSESDRSSQWLFNAKGQVVSTEKLRSMSPKALYWDADNQKELLEDGLADDPASLFHIANYPARDGLIELRAPEDTATKDFKYFKPLAVLDLVGDWREELVVADRGRILVYASNIPARTRNPWLMTNHTYRMGVAANSVGYYQQPMFDGKLEPESTAQDEATSNPRVPTEEDGEEDGDAKSDPISPLSDSPPTSAGGVTAHYSLWLMGLVLLLRVGRQYKSRGKIKQKA